MQTALLSSSHVLPASLLPALDQSANPTYEFGTTPKLSAERCVARLDQAGFTEIEVTLEDGALWCMMKPVGRPSFTPPLLSDLNSMQRVIQDEVDWKAERPFDFLVFGSRTRGVFNLGGDLALFQDCIERRDVGSLRRYAHRCVEVVHANHAGYQNRIITLALIEGDALGGGFESGLSCDFLIAERQAKFGFPEVLFNLFPGMGAYSLLSRRIGIRKTEEMLRTGKTYSADELCELGVIDLVVDAGEGRQAVLKTIQLMRSRLHTQAALYEVRRRVSPVTLQELRDIADIWVDTAFRLQEQDLRRMSRITLAQDRSHRRQPNHEAADQ